ncbi:MAG: DUF3795 domain-containing protein [Oscillospiraceae bacterium]|nr:DUF3795 domain-containing protein [Oscillospiraceae bacterium]
MYHFHADNGRILTPPTELEPQLKGAFPVFSKLLGHIRFNYVADEIWDGEVSLVFKADGEQLAAVMLGEGAFHVQIAGEDFRIADETLLDTVFETLKSAVSFERRRPLEQRTINPNGCPCGRQCDLCLGSKEYSENGFSEGENFGYMNWVCYHNCIDDIVERFDGVFDCPGCEAIRTSKDCWEDWNGCKYFICLTERGYKNCAECGEYHTCDVFRDCHYPAQCNLGITAEEITKLVIPYAMKERLNTFHLTRETRNV